MRIYNYQNRPHLILTNEELLFRDKPSDAQVKRHPYQQIKQISFFHRYDANKEAFIWMKVQMKEQVTPLLVQLSLLNEPVEEVLEGIALILPGKVKIKFPSKSWLKRVKNNYKAQKMAAWSVFFLLISLPIVHFMFPPQKTDLKDNPMELTLLENKGICSARIKAIYPTSDPQTLESKKFCALFMTWQEESSKHFPKEFLSTELSTLGFDDYIQRAEDKIDAKSYDEALNNIQQAIYLDPNDETSQILLAKLKDRQHQPEEAMALLNKALQMNPQSSRAHNFLGELYIEKGQMQEAKEHFQTSLKFEQNAYIYSSLAYTEQQLGLTDQAIEHYEYSLHDGPDDTYVLTELGILYWQRQEYEQAAEKLQRAYELEPNDLMHFLNLYEISLITSASIDQASRDKFVTDHQNDPAAMLVHDMLHIIELSIQNKPTEDALAQWTQQYEGHYPDWSLSEMRSWLDGAKLQSEHLQKVQQTLGFFIAKQQAYKIQHAQVAQ